MSYNKARVIRNPSSFLIGATEYKDQVTKVRIVPDTPIQTTRSWGGVDQDLDSTSYVLEISGHSFRGTGGLVAALDAAHAAGTDLTATITPRTGTGEDVATVTFKAVPTEFGGEAGSWKGFEAEFPVVDEPEYDQQD